MKQVVYVVEDKEAAQFRYRVKNVCEALEKSKTWRGEYCLKYEIPKNDFSDVDILVILRQTDKDGKILNLIRRAKKSGTKVLFDLDDLVFDYRDLGLVARSVREKNLLYWVGYFWGIRRVAKKVDGFLTTNEFLAGKLERSFGKPVKVIRNSLNREQIEASEVYVKKKREKDEKFVIGYFSGSPTHQKDLEVAMPGVMKFLDEHDDAILNIVGFMRFSEDVQKYVVRKKICFLPFTDFRKLQRLMAEVDVNIAPLVVNDFTNCKSELKFFEAAVAETTTIASPTHAFLHAIRDGENGLIAQDDEWYEKLEYLYNNPEENRKMAKQAEKDALEKYYGAEFLEEVEEAYEFFAE